MKDLASEVYASGTGRLSITMITAVYLSSKAFISFQLGLDDMYHVKENRNFILRRIYSVLYSIVFALALIFYWVSWCLEISSGRCIFQMFII